jgi:hypothetical protein
MSSIYNWSIVATFRRFPLAWPRNLHLHRCAGMRSRVYQENIEFRGRYGAFSRSAGQSCRSFISRPEPLAPQWRHPPCEGDGGEDGAGEEEGVGRDAIGELSGESMLGGHSMDPWVDDRDEESRGRVFDDENDGGDDEPEPRTGTHTE